jgi:quercetin dioxygenase-like cupin family protein
MVGNMKDLEAKILKSDLVKNASMKVLVGAQEGWDDYVMRVVELGVDGYSPKHQHPWPHINFMIEGTGIVMIDGVDHEVSAGSYSFVPENTIHQFRNTGSEMFKFICIVPKEGHQ